MNQLFSLLCLQQANNIKFLDVVSNRLLSRFTNKKVYGQGVGCNTTMSHCNWNFNLTALHSITGAVAPHHAANGTSIILLAAPKVQKMKIFAHFTRTDQNLKFRLKALTFHENRIQVFHLMHTKMEST